MLQIVFLKHGHYDTGGITVIHTCVFDKTGRNALTGATTRSNNLPGFYVAIT